jgi:hypothetical protein
MSQHQFLAFVTALLPSWRKSQRRVLALAVRAMVLRPCATLSGLARALPATTKLIHRLKRLERFVSNPRLDLLEGWAALAHWAISLRPTGWLPLLLDETGLRDRATILTAAIPYRGRALPVAALAFSPPLIRRSLWALREGLVWAVVQTLGEHRARLVVVADRAFAASHFFRWLTHPKVRLHFVVRVSAKVYVQWEGFKTLLSSLEVEPGCWVWLPQLRYGPKQALLNVLIVWRHGCKEPWILASSLDDPRAIYRLYRQRMRIEALFKDAKGYFRLEECQVQTGARLSTLCFVLCAALWWLALVVPTSPQWHAQVRLRGQLSWLRQALEWLQQMMLSAFLDHPPQLPLSLPQVRQSG